MLKLTLTTDGDTAGLNTKVDSIARLLGVDVEVVGLDGYTVAAFIQGAEPPLLVNNPQAPVAEVPTPVFTPPAPVFTTPEPVEQTNG